MDGGVTYSNRSLPPGVREEAQARSTVVRRSLTELRTDVMPRNRPMDIDRWEREMGPEVIRVITRAQAENAELVNLTHGMTLTAQGYQLEPLGYLDPTRFSGVMPDGDPLDLIPKAVANRVRERLETGSSPQDAWRAGGELLATITQTALSDSSRMAKMVAGLATPRTLYIRVLNPPACPRCVVLAGKRGHWAEPFQRHPNCDCSQIPVPEGSEATFEGPEFDPQAAFDAMGEGEQDARFGKAAAEAIREGADLTQVVNSFKGMSAAGSRFTKAGSTRRGIPMQYHLGADNVPRGVPAFDRLSVPEIIRVTENDPQRRTALLYRHGYLTSQPPGRSLTDVTAAINQPSRSPRRAGGASSTPRPAQVASAGEARGSYSLPARGSVGVDARLSHDYEARTTTSVSELRRRKTRAFGYAQAAHGSGAQLPTPRVHLMKVDRRGTPAEESLIRGTSHRDRSSMVINGTRQGQELTILHELGHHIDWQTRAGNAALFNEVMGEIRSSDTIRELESLRTVGVKQIGFKRYFSSDAEVFARAYAQWVAVKTREPRLNNTVARHRDRQTIDGYAQWPDEDFDRHVLPALDRYFQEVYG